MPARVPRDHPSVEGIEERAARSSDLIGVVDIDGTLLPNSTIKFGLFAGENLLFQSYVLTDHAGRFETTVEVPNRRASIEVAFFHGNHEPVRRSLAGAEAQSLAVSFRGFTHRSTHSVGLGDGIPLRKITARVQIRGRWKRAVTDRDGRLLLDGAAGAVEPPERCQIPVVVAHAGKMSGTDLRTHSGWKELTEYEREREFRPDVDVANSGRLLIRSTRPGDDKNVQDHYYLRYLLPGIGSTSWMAWHTDEIEADQLVLGIPTGVRAELVGFALGSDHELVARHTWKTGREDVLVLPFRKPHLVESMTDFPTTFRVFLARDGAWMVPAQSQPSVTPIDRVLEKVCFVRQRDGSRHLRLFPSLPSLFIASPKGWAMLDESTTRVNPASEGAVFGEADYAGRVTLFFADGSLLHSDFDRWICLPVDQLPSRIVVTPMTEGANPFVIDAPDISRPLEL